jgi:hypothetical protein
MSQDKNEQEPEKVVAINDAPTALTANMAAAAKLASRLRAAGADLPQEVWLAIEEGRTQDFQNHPDFMAATRLMMFGQVSSELAARMESLPPQRTTTTCARCRGLHAEGSCLIEPETRWQRFRSALVKLWRRLFGKIKAGPQVPRYQRALLPGEVPILRPDGRKPFPRNYDGAAEAKIAENMGVERFISDPAHARPGESDLDRR